MTPTDIASSVNIGVVIGSTRQQRFAEHPARWIADLLGQQPGVEVQRLDLRDYDLPNYDETVAPAMLGEQRYADPAVVRWTEAVEAQDGFILVGPEYNHGYSAVLRNALDYVYQGWNRKPVAFIGYGNMGGARAIEQLRQVTVELQMVPLAAAVHLPLAPLIAHFTGGDGSAALPESNDKAAAMIADLLWWSRALKVARHTPLLALAS
jgi:NAD(P)H-dependent FMN reductase